MSLTGLEFQPNRDDLLDEFDRTWAKRQTASLADMLQRLPNGSGDNVSLARELCLIDLEYRWRLAAAGTLTEDEFGGRPKLADYAGQWPELRDELSETICLAEEYRVRRLWGDDPTPDSFLAEQPAANPALLAALRQVDKELEADEAGEDHFASGKPASTPVDPRAPLPFSDYTLHELVGAGGMSKVYRATQRSLDRTVAIKALRKSFLRDEQAVDRFVEEGRAFARLQHSNIVAVHGLGRFPGGGYFLVLQYIAGSNLATATEAKPLPLPVALRVTAQVARAIEHAHSQGVIHCDLKPSNILLGRQETIYLTDFGLAQLKTRESAAALRPGGTLGFMAPELALDDSAPPTPAIDVYGLGALFYALITGRPPVSGDTWPEFVAALEHSTPGGDTAKLVPMDRELGKYVAILLSKSPAHRPPTAAEVATELERYLLR